MGSMSQLLFDFYCAVAIWGLTLLCGILPFRLQKTGGKYRSLISFTNAFAGGVFLNAAIFHLLIEAAEGFEDSSLEPYKWPLAVLLCVAGGSIARVLEMHGHRHDKERKDSRMEDDRVDGSADLEASVVGNVAGGTSERRGGYARAPLSDRELEDDAGASPATTPDDGHSLPPSGVSNGAALASSHLLFLVLSVHSFLAGTALGIESGKREQLMTLFAIIAHKGSESFAFGAHLIRSHGLQRYRTALFLLLCFSLMTPLGIFSGAITQVAVSHHNAYAITAVIQAISSGTFVYVGVGHIFLEEYRNPNNKKAVTLLAFAVGFVVMYLCTALEGEHHHGGEHVASDVHLM